MSFDDILEHAVTDALLMVNGQEFVVAGMEKVKLMSGDHLMWLWSTDGLWLIVDREADELIIMQPAEHEVEEDDDYVTYAGGSYEEMQEDQGAIEAAEGEADHEVGAAFTVKQFENGDGGLLRSLDWTGYGDELWFHGKMLEEDDVQVA